MEGELPVLLRKRRLHAAEGGKVGWMECTDGGVGEEEVERRGVMCADPSSSVTP